MIGSIVLFNNEIFYASVWCKVSPTRTDILTLSKDEYLITPFIRNNTTK